MVAYLLIYILKNDLFKSIVLYYYAILGMALIDFLLDWQVYLQPLAFFCLHRQEPLVVFVFLSRAFR